MTGLVRSVGIASCKKIRIGGTGELIRGCTCLGWPANLRSWTTNGLGYSRSADLIHQTVVGVAGAVIVESVVDLRSSRINVAVGIITIAFAGHDVVGIAVPFIDCQRRPLWIGTVVVHSVADLGSTGVGQRIAIIAITIASVQSI